MQLKSPLLAVLATSPTLGAQAWYIDPISCGKNPTYLPRLHPSIESAFSLANESVVALEKVVKNETDMNEKVEELAGWLFGKRDGQNG